MKIVMLVMPDKAHCNCKMALGVTYGVLHVLPADKYKAHIGRGDLPEGDHGRPGQRLAQREPAVEHREDGVQRLHPPPQHQLHGGQGLQPAPNQGDKCDVSMSCSTWYGIKMTRLRKLSTSGEERAAPMPQIFHKLVASC